MMMRILYLSTENPTTKIINPPSPSPFPRRGRRYQKKHVPPLGQRGNADLFLIFGLILSEARAELFSDFIIQESAMRTHNKHHLKLKSIIKTQPQLQLNFKSIKVNLNCKLNS